MPLAHSPCYAPPRGLLTPWGVAPHPTFATWQGCRGKPPAPLPRSVGSPPTCKGQAASGCFASLDRFPAPSASDRLLPPRRWRGQGRRSRAFLPLTPWSRPNTHRRGRWIGFATCPCGLASESGVWGKAPRSYFLFLMLLG